MRRKKTFRDPLDKPLQQLRDLQKILIGLSHTSGVTLKRNNQLTKSDNKQLKERYNKRDRAIFACVKADKTQLFNNPIIKERIEDAQRYCQRDFFEDLSVAVKTGVPTLPTLEEIKIENAVIEGKEKGESLQKIFDDLPPELVGNDYENFKKKVSRNPNLRGMDPASKELVASRKSTRQ